ncbi:MAG: DUF2922 domain-containing protein [Firmicutes bacterium]|nr:DUF2922 domain-containing protein [Bacillota bacterium]
MVFRNAQGRNTTLSVADPQVDLEAAEVSAAMDEVLDANIFNTTGGDIISKVRAQIVDRQVETLAEF